MEKIVETPRETIIIDDITDITKIKSINDRTERTTDITDITDINRIKNTINLHETEENILREVTKENVVVRKMTLNSKKKNVKILLQFYKNIETKMVQRMQIFKSSLICNSILSIRVCP